MSKAEAIHLGAVEASKTSCMGWFMFGVVWPLLALPAVHLRRPYVPALVAAKWEGPDTQALYEAGFIDQLKTQQVVATWMGAGCGVAVILFVWALM